MSLKFVIFFCLVALLCYCQQSQGAAVVRTNVRRANRVQRVSNYAANNNDAHDLVNVADEEDDEDTNDLAVGTQNLLNNDEVEQLAEVDNTEDVGSRRRRGRGRRGRGRRNRRRTTRRRNKRVGGRRKNRKGPRYFRG